MAEIVNPAPPPPESPLVGSSYVGPAVKGAAFGKGNPGISGQSLPPPRPPGVVAEVTEPSNTMGDGVYGNGLNGVHGVSAYDAGVLGENSDNGYGVSGQSEAGTGVHGLNGAGSGTNPKFGCGVFGDSADGFGVYGASKTASGVYGTSPSGHFAGEFDGDVSITGDTSAKNIKLSGSLTANDANIAGDIKSKSATLSDNLTAADIKCKSATLSGNLTAIDVILSGADCAEEFDADDVTIIEPGSVVVFDDNGVLNTTKAPYNKRVAGVVSGAGAYRPAVILDRRLSDRRRLPVALLGKVYCKVDASYAPIEIGDFLTTSPTTGHAMKVTDISQAFGSVIGKALAPLRNGYGLIPILVSLQ